MPLFEYQCEECGHVTVFLEKAGAKGPHKCEKCGSAKTVKLLSSFAVGDGGSSGSAGSSGSSCPTGTCPLS
ncbi:MAG: zinc ribbon domain-containing protein [Verrucomicrobia bacterium]|nr:zinc ribbon domain-containing protein [Verrucomicrobiota bacterium]